MWISPWHCHSVGTTPSHSRAHRNSPTAISDLFTLAAYPLLFFEEFWRSEELARSPPRPDARRTGVHKLRELARSRAGTRNSCSAAAAGNRLPPEGMHAPRPGGRCAAERRLSTKYPWPHGSRGPRSRGRTERGRMREPAGGGALPRRDGASPLRRATRDSDALLFQRGWFERLEAEAISDAKKAALDTGGRGSQQGADTQAAEASRDEGSAAESSAAESRSTESRTEGKSRAQVGGGGCSCAGAWAGAGRSWWSRTRRSGKAEAGGADRLRAGH